jgi:hypothetical protein
MESVTVLRIVTIVVRMRVRRRAGIAMRMRMGVGMIITMFMMIMVFMRMGLMGTMFVGVPVIMVPMIVVTMIMVVVVARRDRLLRPERAQHRGCRAALATDQLRDGGIVRHIDRVSRHLGEAVLAAELPGKADEAHGILGSHLEQAFLRGLDLHQSPVIEPKRVAVVEHGVHLEVHIDVKAGFAVEMGVAARAGRVTQGHCIDDAVGFHGGLADDGNSAGHGGLDSGKGSGDL